MSTAYHPQTDGTTERYMQEIETYLSIYCISNPTSWKESLITLKIVHNSRVHSLRKHSPFELWYRYQPPFSTLTHEQSIFPNIQEKLQQLSLFQQEALSAHEESAKRMTDRLKQSWDKYKLHDKVWLESTNLRLPYNRKISTKREGPFKITKITGPVNYQLELPKTWKMHNIFHACFLHPYKETNIHGPNYIRPPPEEIKDQDEYKIERILNHCKLKDGHKYFILWKGYPITEATWEPEENLEHTKDVLEEYWTIQKQKELHKRKK